MGTYSADLQVVHLARETTPGTAVTADKQLSNMMLDLDLDGEDNEEVFGSGHMVATETVNGIEWSKGSYETKPTFDESMYIFDSLFKTAAPSGAGAAKMRAWAPAVAGADTFKTYSIEQGVTGAVLKFTFGVFTGMVLNVSKRGAKITGAVLAQEAGEATAFSQPSPTDVASNIIPGTAFALYSATSWANLTAAPTLLTTGWEFEFSYTDKYVPGYFINPNEPSFDTLTPVKPKQRVKITVPYDVSGTDFAGLFNMSKKRLGTPVWLRLKAVGDELETGVNELFQIDFALKIVKVPSKKKDMDAMLGLVWELVPFKDPAVTKSIEVTTICGTAAA